MPFPGAESASRLVVCDWVVISRLDIPPAGRAVPLSQGDFGRALKRANRDRFREKGTEKVHVRYRSTP